MNTLEVKKDIGFSQSHYAFPQLPASVFEKSKKNSEIFNENQNIQKLLSANAQKVGFKIYHSQNRDMRTKQLTIEHLLAHCIESREL